MRRRLGPIVLACAAAMALLLAGAAPAAAAAPHLGFLAGFEGSNGYLVGLETAGHKQVRLSVVGNDLFTSSTYTVRGRVTRDGIEAKLGSLGAISVRFVAQRKRHPAHGRRACRQRQLQVGELRGTIRFRGEDGYTTVAVHRAGAIRLLPPRGSCRANAPHKRPAERSQVALTLLAATQRSPGRRLSFEALGLEEVGVRRGEPFSIPGLLVFADLSEHRGRVSIRRSALLLFEEGILLSEAKIHPTQITVGLPPPFSGTADFREVPGADPTWVGDFAVSFPGAPRVPLTGPGFQVGFCRNVSKRAFERCAKPFEEALSSGQLEAGRPWVGAAQVSGSQSQAFWDVSASWFR